ncbi:MAG: ABC transporter ATP-binding protein [Planctomycetota bacterium]
MSSAHLRVRLDVEDVGFAYGSSRILDGVSASLTEGRLLGLVGPNGAGKSTLLRCLHGALRPRRGRVLLDGADVATLSPRELARRIAVVPQASSPAFAVRVDHFVGMGRFAHERFFGGPTPHDLQIVDRALDDLGLSSLRHRPVDELSGGEFRRVLIAQALTQEATVVLFDEPIQQLDLLHQLEVMEFARAFSRRPGCAGIVVLHDLGLAARFCDELVLLHGGRVLASGVPEDVLTREHIAHAYGVEAVVERSAATGAIEVVPLRAAPA